LSEPDEKIPGSSDVAKSVHVFVLDHFADELGAVLASSVKRLIDVVYGEHHAEITEGVDRGVPVVGHHGRRDEPREFEAAVAVRRAHHRDLHALVAEAGDAPCPFSFHDALTLELEAELE
jgi:hypothetical protein